MLRVDDQDDQDLEEMDSTESSWYAHTSELSLRAFIPLSGR